MKKIIALVLVLALALSFTFVLVSCADNKSEESGYKITPNPVYKDIKIGVIHIGDPADGSGYSYAHDQGIVGMQMALGITDSQVIRKLNVPDDNEAATKIAIEDCIAQGAKIIFGTSFGYQFTMDELASEYPNVIFSHGSGYLRNEDNMNNYFGRIYQARYLAGIAAGLKTATNKIGYVAAHTTKLAETCSGINAFALGVKAANPNAKIFVKDLNSWYDPVNETLFAEALIELGCDVITQHCDTANPQIAAQKAGVWGCGYNSDMTKDAPLAHLTAPIWNWEVYYTTAVSAAAKGREYFMQNVSSNWFGGLAEGFVDVSPVTLNAAPGTKSAINQVKAMIINGDFDVFEGRQLEITVVDGIATIEMTDVEEGYFLVKGHDLSEDFFVNVGDAYTTAEEKAAIQAVIQGTMNTFVDNIEPK